MIGRPRRRGGGSRPRRRIWPALAIGGLVAAGAVALLLVARDGSERGTAARGAELSAAVTLIPRFPAFGDTVSARVDVLVDRRVVDPGSIRVRQEFSPWLQIRPPQRTRSDAGDTSLVRVTYTLRCIISPCVPPRETAPLEFNPSRITYRRTDGRPARPVEVRWPVLVVHSNIVASDLARPEAVASPWKADLVSFPAVSYRLPPGLLRWLLTAGGLLLVLGGATLAYLAVPRKQPEAEPEPEPEPEPELTPLERALRLLTAELPSNGAADQRRALELVAEEMEGDADGDLRIARRARMLAWSEGAPTLEQTSELAGRVREWLALHAPPEEPVPEGGEPEREEDCAPAS